jgi:hypothetical protein
MTSNQLCVFHFKTGLCNVTEILFYMNDYIRIMFYVIDDYLGRQRWSGNRSIGHWCLDASGNRQLRKEK